MTEPSPKDNICPHTIPAFRHALESAAGAQNKDGAPSMAEKLCAPARGRSAAEILTAPDCELK